jgi:hypothetical protein
VAIQPIDSEELRRQYVAAEPFPFVKIDNLLEPGFADEVSRSFPSYQSAAQQGTTFKTVNERRKVQITESKLFPEPARRLSEALAAPEFLALLSRVSGIPNLLADDQLVGGGLHVTGPGGRLDVHVDFNFLRPREWHRRLNLLLYLNPVWQDAWGGHIQLWDRRVSKPNFRNQRHQLSRSDTRQPGGPPRAPVIRGVLLHARTSPELDGRVSQHYFPGTA